MKVVILAGGQGTRLAEETSVRPKPMVEIGGQPILWHIMRGYAAHGFNDFVVCLGYRGYYIKEYFSNYFLHNSDVTFDLGKNQVEWHRNHGENWRVTLVDTGENTMTGGRLARVAEHLTDDTFCLTYGDAVCDVDVSALVKFHQSHGRQATVTAVETVARFGNLRIDDNQSVSAFEEKPLKTDIWINGGYFVLNRNVIDLVDGDSCIWERKPLETLSSRGDLMCYKHSGFWHCMDTIRDKSALEELWAKGAPWKTW